MPRDATPGTLSPKQKRAIELLLSTVDLAAVAREIGVDRSTLHRWQRQPAFRNALHAAEADALTEVSRGLVRLSRLALRTMGQAMADEEAAVGVKIRAADAVLNRLVQLRTYADMEARLRVLEEAAGITSEGRRA